MRNKRITFDDMRSLQRSRYVPRFIKPVDAKELVNLYHLSKVPLSGTWTRYQGMLWASKEFSLAHPDISTTAAYKDLEGLLS